MNTRLLSLGIACLIIRSYCPMASADELRTVDRADDPQASVSVLCYGRLRHGILAIGGETTGTTITFDQVTWELQLPDEASRQFAEKHHKQPVVVTGTLRKVKGIEIPERWIVDVNRIAEPEEREAGEEGAKVTIQGTLRAALSQTGQVPDLSVSTGNQRWALDITAEPGIQTAAESLILQTVIVSGHLVPFPQDSPKATLEAPSATRYRLKVRSIRPVPVK